MTPDTSIVDQIESLPPRALAVYVVPVILAQEAMEPPPLRGPSLLEQLKESGPIGMAALAAVLLAVILILGAPYLAASRRQLAFLIGAAICLGVGGYVVFDREYLEINLQLRDAQAIREECVKLLQHAPKATAEGTQGGLLIGRDIPPTFARLGARSVVVTEKTVRLSFVWAPMTGTEHGILYAPQGPTPWFTFPLHCRHTLYRDFYEYRIRGE